MVEGTDTRKEAETLIQRRRQSHDNGSVVGERDKAHNWKDKGFPRKRRSKDWPEEDR